MENQFGQNFERILSKKEILEVLGRYVDNFVFVREQSDEKGICLLEVKVTNPETGEIAEYQYMRKGKLTSIHVAYYNAGNEIPISGDMVAEFNSETGKWKDAKGYVKK